jgi:oligopeptide transport system substrate-binding protein
MDTAFRSVAHLYRLLCAVFILTFLANCKNNGDDSAGAPLRYGVPELTRNTDPHRASSADEQRLVSHLFLGLVTKDNTGQIVPGVAESWVVSPDGLSYVFRLRKSEWSDGTPVTAATFVEAFRRLFSARQSKQQARDYISILNASEILAGKKPAKALGIKALTPEILEIRLVHPQPEFLDLVGASAAAPIPTHAMRQRSQLWPQPKMLVTNGPYKINSMGSVQTRLEPNYKYALSGFEKRLPVEFILQKDSATALSAFLAGELDMVDAQAVPMDVVMAEAKLRNQLRQEPAWTSVHMILKSDAEKLKNPRLRVALSMSLDRQAMLESLFRQLNYQIGYSITPALLSSYATPAQPDWAGITMQQRLTDARRLFQELGITENTPLELDLVVADDPELEKVARYLQGYWQQFGIVLKLKNQSRKQKIEVIEAGAFEVALLATTSETDRPDPFFSRLTCAREKMTGYCNREVDNLIDNALTQSDLVVRAGAFRQAERLILQDMPVVPLYTPKRRILVSENIQGWSNNAAGRHPSEYLSRGKKGF